MHRRAHSVPRVNSSSLEHRHLSNASLQNYSSLRPSRLILTSVSISIVFLAHESSVRSHRLIKYQRLVSFAMSNGVYSQSKKDERNRTSDFCDQRDLLGRPSTRAHYATRRWIGQAKDRHPASGRMS
ncbi:hypothetical protein CBOM_07786 [Ceraceosorus bombacis]|uniref:Uncharacterized protein n=1 Tax=Ceraceosorus bombacis TaxID=401625 RepID=A0A0P1BLS7_9BASI|nr:hypothetical protein CBOM_07786 [Ceraceosorus bombacis]